jgi:hypothetical protein
MLLKRFRSTRLRRAFFRNTIGWSTGKLWKFLIQFFRNSLPVFCLLGLIVLPPNSFFQLHVTSTTIIVPILFYCNDTKLHSIMHTSDGRLAIFVRYDEIGNTQIVFYDFFLGEKKFVNLNTECLF